LVSAHVSWTTREHPTELISLATLRRLHEYPNRLRMCSFDCNAPDVTGYSIATNGVSIATIHAHRYNDVSIYKDVDSSRYMIWIYMPVDPGEYVTEICRRYGFRHVKMDSLGLMVRRQWYIIVE